MLIEATRIYLADYFSASARLILQYIDIENKAWFPWQPRYEMAVHFVALSFTGFDWYLKNLYILKWASHAEGYRASLASSAR